MNTNRLEDSFESYEDLTPAGEIELDAIKDYFNAHHEIPQEYYGKDLPELVKEKIKVLLDKETKLKQKRKALILLAHQRSLDSLHALQKYLEDPDEELRVFALLALDECKANLTSEFMERPVIRATKISLKEE